jgi:hypothetical protein
MIKRPHAADYAKGACESWIPLWIRFSEQYLLITKTASNFEESLAM